MSRIALPPIDAEPVDAIPQWIWDLPKIDTAHMGAVKCLPCVVCQMFGLTQTSTTDAHHPIHGRFGNRRAPDGAVIPLCKCHHQGLRFDRDKSKLAIHQGKIAWAEAYGNDYDFVKQTIANVERMDTTIDF